MPSEDADDAYVASVGASLVAEALVERAALVAEEERLKSRLSAADRRIRVAYAPEAQARDAGTAWLSSSGALGAMKGRLEKAAVDEEELMKLVAEVRSEKDERTEMALQFYRERTERLLGGGAV